MNLKSVIPKQELHDLKLKYDELYRKKFPDGYRGKEINSIDLVMIDADTMGCISSFVNYDGKIDPWRLAILGLCYKELFEVTNHLDGYAKEYYGELEKLAEAVLKSFIKNNRERYQ